jgi:resorcinol 4-hydroxylase (FADH2)
MAHDAAVGNASVSTEILVERARELIPTLRQRAAATEQERRVPMETVEQFRAAGLFTILQPPRYGGQGGGFVDYIRIAYELGRGCASSGWIYANAALHSWHLGMFPPEAQDDIWRDDPGAITSSSYAPTGTATPVEGGYRLTGRWNYASGCDNTTWSILGARVEQPGDGAAPVQVWFLVPRDDYRIEDNWQVMGLAGTGSKDIIVDGAMVPGHRMLTIDQSLSGQSPGVAVNDHPIHRVPLFCAFSFFIAAPIVGMARGAFDEYVTLVRGRKTRGGVAGGGVLMASLPTIQLRIGEAEMKIDAARAMLLGAAADCMAEAATETGVEMDQRLANRRAQAYATRLAREAVDELFDSAGASGVFLDNSAQRWWRDIHAAAKHFSLNWDAVRLTCAQYTLGLEPEGMY